MDLSFFYFCQCLAFYSLSAVAYQFSVPLCHTNMFKNEFFIPQPEKCIKHNSFRVHTCRAAVYYPSKHVLQIPITTCEMYKTTSSTTFYFFGAKVSNEDTVPMSPPPVEICSIWARELKSGCCGTLEKKSDHIWSTINAPAVKYVWPTSHEESVTNAVVLRSTAVYDHLKKQLSSSLYQLGNCDIKKGSCVAGNRVHFWDVPKRLECPNVQKVKSVHNISLHSDMRGNVYRLEVKTLGISLHSQIQCPPSVHTCFPKNAVCDPSGIVIVPDNCRSVGRLRTAHSATFNTHSSTDPLFASFVTESADIMSETINNLNADIHFLECQIQSIFSTMYSILGKSFPGPVLSALLRRHTAAITIGDVLTELMCIPVNATLLKSLKHGNYFSLRPLVQYVDHLNVTRVGQLYGDGNLYEGVHLVEQFIPGRVFTFRINGKFHTFQNYTLTHADADICPLSPHLAPLRTHYDALDYQSFVNLFPSSNLGIEDVNSVLRTLSEANLMHHQLTRLFETKPSSTASADPSILLDSSTSLLKNVFLQMISCLTNPFLSGFLSILLSLASSGLLF